MSLNISFFIAFQAFLCIALIMGDGTYHFFKVFGVTVKSLHERLNRKRATNRGEKMKNNRTISSSSRGEKMNNLLLLTE
jgi:hypothetical protein